MTPVRFQGYRVRGSGPLERAGKAFSNRATVKARHHPIGTGMDTEDIGREIAFDLPYDQIAGASSSKNWPKTYMPSRLNPK